MTKTPRNPRPSKAVIAPQVLILTPGDTLLYDSKLREKTITLGEDKIRGPLQVIDLTGLVQTTYTSMDAFKEEEVAEAVTLDPSSYLPREQEAAEVHVAALATLNDEDKTAALITYAQRQAITDLNSQLGSNPTFYTSALITAASEYLNRDDDSIVLQIGDEMMVSLLIMNGKIRARAREFVSPNAMPDQAMNFLGQTAGLSSNLNSIGLVGRPDYVEMVEHALSQDTNVAVKVFTPGALARTALRYSAPLNIRTHLVRKPNLLLPIGTGLVAGLLPWLILNGINQATQASIDSLKHQSLALGPQVEQAHKLKDNIERIQDIQTKATAIEQNRVDWYSSLQKLTEALPNENGDYTVKLRSLNGKIINAPAPGTPPSTTTATPTTPAAGTASSQTPSLVPPIVAYDLDLVAVSKYAATSLISNFENMYNFNLTHVGRDPKTASLWNINATATEKESSAHPIQAQTQGTVQP